MIWFEGIQIYFGVRIAIISVLVLADLCACFLLCY